MRREGDSWDIRSSVGATALFVAIFRALESQREHPIISDPFAQYFIKSADHPTLTLETIDSWPGPLAALMKSSTTSLALRTYGIDEAILSHPTPQLVILAAGLDSRPYRLNIPSTTRVFELDLPDIIDFKRQVYAALHAQPQASVATVTADLRSDWIPVLEQAGFDSTVSTTWVSEGLLPYLRGSDQFALRDAIVAHSAPHSQWLFDFCDRSVLAPSPEKPSSLFARTANQMSGLEVHDLFYDVHTHPTKEQLLDSLDYSSENFLDMEQRIHYTHPSVTLTAQQKEDLRALLASAPDVYSSIITPEGDVVPESISVMPYQQFEVVTVHL